MPDLLEEGVQLLLVGINPGLRSAAVQSHFAAPGNRFYPALRLAGIIDRAIDASSGLSAADRSHLVHRGIGITNLAARTTARADELTTIELVEGTQILRQKVRAYRPNVVAILGISAFRSAFAAPQAVLGRQPTNLEAAQLWVIQNPSGRNAHASLTSLAASYREVAIAAGLDL